MPYSVENIVLYTMATVKGNLEKFQLHGVTMMAMYSTKSTVTLRRDIKPDGSMKQGAGH